MFRLLTRVDEMHLLFLHLILCSHQPNSPFKLLDVDIFRHPEVFVGLAHLIGNLEVQIRTDHFC